jgi:hypothetical protein
MINTHFNSNITIADIFRLPNIDSLAGFIENGDDGVKELKEGLNDRMDALNFLSNRIN